MAMSEETAKTTDQQAPNQNPTMEMIKKIQEKIQGKLQSEFPHLGHRISESAEKATQMAQNAGQTATHAAQIAADVAKQGIDQFFISLEHKGINVRDPQDLVQKVGRRVLERAETIRSQLAENPLSPAWLKDVSFDLKAKSKNSSTRHANGAGVDSGNESSTSFGVSAGNSAGVNAEAESMASAAAGSIVESARSIAADDMQAPHTDSATIAERIVSGEAHVETEGKKRKNGKRGKTADTSSSAE